MYENHTILSRMYEPCNWFAGFQKSPAPFRAGYPILHRPHVCEVSIRFVHAGHGQARAGSGQVRARPRRALRRSLRVATGRAPGCRCRAPRSVTVRPERRALPSFAAYRSRRLLCPSRARRIHPMNIRPEMRKVRPGGRLGAPASRRRGRRTSSHLALWPNGIALGTPCFLLRGAYHSGRIAPSPGVPRWGPLLPSLRFLPRLRRGPSLHVARWVRVDETLRPALRGRCGSLPELRKRPGQFAPGACEPRMVLTQGVKEASPLRGAPIADRSLDRPHRASDIRGSRSTAARGRALVSRASPRGGRRPRRLLDKRHGATVDVDGP